MKRSLTISHTYNLVFLFFWFVSSIYSQGLKIEIPPPGIQKSDSSVQKILNRQQNFFRTAQSYINMKRYDQAIKILEQLVQERPDNFSYYQSLFRTYLTMGQVTKADSLVKFMSKKYSNNYQFRIDEANLLFRQNQKEAAISLWSEILEQNKKTIGVYHQVASSMLENQLYEMAIKVYQQAIKALPKTDYLYQTIASIYQNRLMFSEAADNLLKYLEKEPQQQSYVFTRILSFQIDPEDRPPFFKALGEWTKKTTHPENIHLLLAQLYQRYGNFEKAFEIYKELKAKQDNLKYLLEFASSAAADSSFEVALKAYSLLLDQFPQNQRSIDVYFGAVSCLLNLAEKNNSENYAEQALVLIDDAQRFFPNHPDLSGLIFLKGIFKMEYFFDLDAAIKIFYDLSSQQNSKNKFRVPSLVKLGECYLKKGDLENARLQFEKVKAIPKTYLAHMQLARTYYFKKEWQKATEILEILLKQQGTASETANDALELNLRLTMLKGAPDVLEKLSQSDLLIFQHKKSEAANKLVNLLDLTNIPSLLRAGIYTQLINLFLDLENIPQALDYCVKAIDDSSVALYTDRHLFLMATILENKTNAFREAFQAYQNLLQNYPNSMLTEKARERIQFLREEKIIELP
jgi:tetratricopeptide (TPR) repeat protein